MSRRAQHLAGVLVILPLVSTALGQDSSIQDSCSAIASATPVPDTCPVGDVLTVQAFVGLMNTSQSAGTIPEFRFYLDCSGDELQSGCVDEGIIVSYLGDEFITTDHPGACQYEIAGDEIGNNDHICGPIEQVLGGCAPISWTSNQPTGLGISNELIFVPHPALHLNRFSACSVRFGILTESFSLDSTPFEVDQAIEVQASCGEHVSAVSYSTLSFELEPDACCLNDDTCIETTDTACEQLGGVFRGFGTSCDAACVSCAGDVNRDFIVDIADLLALMKSWGACLPQADCPADADHDGDVDVLDLLALISAWGPC